MELGVFIKEVLCQISLGLENAKEGVKGFKIPDSVTTHRSSGEGVVGECVNNPLQMYEKVEFIDFEVILSESTNELNRNGIGVLLSVVGVRAENKKEEKADSVTSVKFRIPIVWT